MTGIFLIFSLLCSINLGAKARLIATERSSARKRGGTLLLSFFAKSRLDIFFARKRECLMFVRVACHPFRGLLDIFYEYDPHKRFCSIARIISALRMAMFTLIGSKTGASDI